MYVQYCYYSIVYSGTAHNANSLYSAEIKGKGICTYNALLCVAMQSTKEVRSRIDTRDPNPAHKLKRSLEELTISHGTKINPRFAETKKHPSQISRRFSSSDMRRVERIQPKHKLRKSVTIGALETFDTPPAKFLSELESLSEQSQDMEDGTTAPMVNSVKNWVMDENGVSTVRPLLNCIQEDDIEVTNTDTDTTVFLKNILSRSSLINSPDSTQGQDVSVQDIEISNTDSDTTVYLQHILAGGKGEVPSLDDEGVGYYEVAHEDDSLIAASALTFPHGIPRLCVLDERDELLEVIVDPPHSLTYPQHSPPQSTNEPNEPSTRL